ncbi:MAG: hypothetical protein WDN26_24040 [Chitinophagaceae bacterium]
MSKETNSKRAPLSFGHPFFIILGVIVIFYGGYLFGQKLYDLFH